MDEHWSDVQHKKKRWLIYAYVPETDEVLGYVIGNRSAKTVRKLYEMLKNLRIDEYGTDNWSAFEEVFAEGNHQVGKRFTCAIEGVNNALRARNRCLLRKTTCFSKKDKYNEAIIKIMFCQPNYDYHTF
ncbi:MAG: IS1 family transposase [Flammeovirgaceae bacterium]